MHAIAGEPRLRQLGEVVGTRHRHEGRLAELLTQVGGMQEELVSVRGDTERDAGETAHAQRRERGLRSEVHVNVLSLLTVQALDGGR